MLISASLPHLTRRRFPGFIPKESLIKCSSSEMEWIRSPSKRLPRKWPQAIHSYVEDYFCGTREDGG
jgi:hypothetical protein